MLMVFSSHGGLSGNWLRMKSEWWFCLFQNSSSCAYWGHEVTVFSEVRVIMVFQHIELYSILLVGLHPCQVSEALFLPLKV